MDSASNYKLSLHSKTNTIQNLTNNNTFFITFVVDGTCQLFSCQICYAAKAAANGLQHLQQATLVSIRN